MNSSTSLHVAKKETSHKRYMVHTLLPSDGRKGIAGPVVDMRPEGATI